MASTTNCSTPRDTCPGRSKSTPILATASQRSTPACSPEETRTTRQRRPGVFHGPGIDNFDVTLQKRCPSPRSKSLDFRVEAFNAFNHAQFYGPASVDGQVEDPNFGSIVSAAAPRLVQLVVKFNF